MSQHPDIDPFRAHAQTTHGGDQAWLDNLIAGGQADNPPLQQETPPPAPDPYARQVWRDPATNRYVRRNKPFYIDEPATDSGDQIAPPEVHSAPVSTGGERGWSWKEWAILPFTSTLVRLQVRGTERRERTNEMMRAYKEAPTFKKLALLAGDLITHATVVLVATKALGSAAQGLELAGIDVPLVGGPASHHQPTQTAPAASVPNVETPGKTTPSPSISPSTEHTQSPAPKPSTSTPTPSPSTSSPNTETNPFTKGGLGGIETETGDTPNTTGESIQVPAELASRSTELGTYEWDSDLKVWKGTAWFQVDQYARDLGIRDQFDTKEFRAIVDQVLIDNKIGGEGASYKERWNAAKDLSDGDVINLDISLFEGKTDKPLVVAGAGGAEIPVVDRFKEDNGESVVLTYDGKQLIIQNDGDFVINGKEINTAVPQGSTLKSYLDGVNKQFDPSMRFGDQEMQQIEAKLIAMPEVVNALGLNVKNPDAPMAFYGNVPVADDAMLELAYRALDSSDAKPSSSPSTPPSPKSSPNDYRGATQEFAWAGPVLTGGGIAMFAVLAALLAVQIRNHKVRQKP